MAKFLDGSGVQAALTEIIKNAEQELFVVAPYIKIPTQTKNYMKNIDKPNINFKIVLRTGAEITKDDLQFLNELNNAKVLLCDNLHAKCFLNEKEGLITSMNLHEHSQTSNWEMGIKFTKLDDSEIYSNALKEINLIVGASKNNPKITGNIAPTIMPGNIHSQPGHNPIAPTISKKNNHAHPPQKTINKPQRPPNKGLFDKVFDFAFGELAFCIRCHDKMDQFSLEKPLCSRCYPKWAKYKDPKFQEKFCHACGEKKNSISYEKPICYDCYKEMYKKRK